MQEGLRKLCYLYPKQKTCMCGIVLYAYLLALSFFVTARHHYFPSQSVKAYARNTMYNDTTPSPVVPGLLGEYLGQEQPGLVARLFAKGIISTDSLEHSAPAFSPDGELVLWTVVHRFKPSFLLEMKKINDEWTQPTPPSFSSLVADDVYPSFSADGKTLYFSSRRAVPDGYGKGIRIWKVKRTKKGWELPEPLDTIVSKGEDYAHSVSDNGTIYFSFRRDGGKVFDIAFSKKQGERWLPPVTLGNGINTSSYEDGPFIAPDESYLIFESGRPGGIEGSIDLYISFKQKGGEWSAPKNMGPAINTNASERFGKVSPDGKFLFFGSNKGGRLFDIYWISAAIIDELRDK